jgi:hypothetical protein
MVFTVGKESGAQPFSTPEYSVVVTVIQTGQRITTNHLDTENVHKLMPKREGRDDAVETGPGVYV